MSFLHEKFRKAARKQNFGGNLPLHCACRGSDSRNVVEILLRSFRDGANIANNKHGHYPLNCTFKRDFAFSTFCSPLVESTTKTKAFQTTATEKDLLPLHAVASCAYTDAFLLRTILERYPDAIHIKDAGGNLPIHHIVGVINYNFWSRGRRKVHNGLRCFKRSSTSILLVLPKITSKVVFRCTWR
jgi:ankyrin repeat protein